MKKANWKTIPTATPLENGLMQKISTIGYTNSVKIIKLTAANPGFLINTEIQMTDQFNIIIRITEHLYKNGDPAMKIIQLYPTQPGANRSTSLGPTSPVELLANNGKLQLYVTPVSTAGYAALVEIFSIDTTNSIVNPSLSLSGISKPAGATVVKTL